MRLRIATPSAVLLVLVSAVSVLNAQTRVYTFDGDSPDDQLGTSVNGAGDVNGDGIPDLIVGAPRDDDNGTDSGSARVISGADGSVLYTFLGPAADARFGASVDGAGDVNGDGFDDVIVGAPGDINGGPAWGSARVFSGADGKELYAFFGITAFGFFGSTVRGAGDVNADGYDDVIISGPVLFGAGPAKLYSGKDGQILRQVLTHGFGENVDGAGDVDGDGFGDIVFGSPLDSTGGTDAGSVRVFSGRNGSMLFRHDGLPFDNLGTSVAGAGDVNGDGYDDVIAGALQFLSGGAGYAIVLSGVDGSMLRTLSGQAVPDVFGASVGGAGDVDGDGLCDVIVGAWSEDGNGINSGSARVYSVPTGTLLLTIFGDSADDQLGSSVAGAGDVNGDGFAEVIIGAPLDDDNGADAGRAFVYDAGSNGTPGREEIYGVACPSSNGNLPRMGYRGDVALGATLEVRLRGALPSAPAAINIGAPISLALGPFGLPGCTAYVDATFGVTLSFATDIDGLSRFSATVPNAPILTGNPVDFQWIVLDPTANAGGFVFSDALRITFGG